MALHPHVVKNAQEELDRVVGNERLPELSDWENLPYISALLKELLRWACPLPLGIPKRVMEDDVYKGYHIPAGANIVENIWSVFFRTMRGLGCRLTPGIGLYVTTRPSFPNPTPTTQNGS